MNRKYWKVNENKGFVQNRRRDLDLLLRLAYQDFAESDSQEIRRFKDDWQRVMGSEVAADDGQADRKTHEELQAYLVGRLNELADTATQIAELPLWTLSGTLQVNANPLTGQFTEEFSLEKGEQWLEGQKKNIDWTLTRLLWDLDLEPGRFRRCARCGKVFYQPTSRDKNYCSKRCAGNERQRRYSEKLKGRKGGAKDKESKIVE
jgi:hypothetical protein